MSFEMMNVRAEACVEAARLSGARLFKRSQGNAMLDRFEDTGTLVMRARRRKTRRRLGGRLLFVFRLSSEDDAGRSTETHVVAALCPRSRSAPGARPREQVRLAIRTVLGVATACVQHTSTDWRDAAVAGADAFMAPRLERERAIVGRIRTTVGRRPYQTGLFDRRADRRRAEENDAAADGEHQIVARLELLEQATARAITVRLVLVLMP
jgi:hypothetical protein